jgi:hypothetical protein
MRPFRLLESPGFTRARFTTPDRIFFAVNSPEVFYLHINGEQRGPYTVQHIDHLLNSGLIAEETLFWREGLEHWLPVTQLVTTRRKRARRRWLRPAIPAIVVVSIFLAVILRIFGPITLDGWRESSQTDYSENAAYWRARDFVRQINAEKGAVVQFLSIDSANVKLEPPDGATAVIHGKVIESRGGTRKGAWRVTLQYNKLRKEWKKRDVEEVATS